MNYRRLNSTLLALIIVVNGYILAAPFWPQLMTWWQLNHTNTVTVLRQRVEHPTPTTVDRPNQLIVPDMGLQAPIGEGTYAHRYDVLHEGMWRYDRGSTPDKGSNTVIAGHRFTYTNPRGIFYALNKVRVGSSIAVIWNNRQYTYVVREIKVVSPNDISIQNGSDDSRLTLFTCTPLWHPTSRLVVVATLKDTQ